MIKKRVKTLPPLRESPDWWEHIEAVLREHIKQTIFLPLLRAITPVYTVMNSLEGLYRMIAVGDLQYTNGHFEGKINAAASRELKKLGATFNRKKGWWEIPQKSLPADLRVAIGTSTSKFKAMSERATKVLESISPEAIAASVSLEKLFDASIFKMDQQFEQNVKKIGVVPKLTPDVQKLIARDYSNNTKLDIKGWAEKEIARLRKTVQENTFDYGLRRETMIKGIEKQFGVSARKAKFLARQETNLLLASFQQGRYLDAGLPKYIWQCVNMPPGSGPHAVRPGHWALKGKIFDWSNPPVVDPQTGRRANPKQDYNCRCLAIPVIE